MAALARTGQEAEAASGCRLGPGGPRTWVVSRSMKRSPYRSCPHCVRFIVGHVIYLLILYMMITIVHHCLLYKYGTSPFGFWKIIWKAETERPSSHLLAHTPRHPMQVELGWGQSWELRMPSRCLLLGGRIPTTYSNMEFRFLNHYAKLCTYNSLICILCSLIQVNFFYTYGSLAFFLSQITSRIVCPFSHVKCGGHSDCQPTLISSSLWFLPTKKVALSQE